MIPRASTAGIAGTRDGALLIRLHSAPVDGAANAELIDVIAQAFGVAKRDVSIVSGERARLKRVRIANIDVRDAASWLESLGVDPRGLSDRAR